MNTFDTHHYAFHLSDREFGDPRNLENRQLNSWNGGRGVYFRDPNGHILELMTRVK